jgi:acarbose 7IV-phosphotransferase
VLQFCDVGEKAPATAPTPAACYNGSDDRLLGEVSMSHILVAGLINIETTLHIHGFPLLYTSVRFANEQYGAVNSTISGVGYNVAKALTMLGDSPTLLSVVGQDNAQTLVKQALEHDGIDDTFVLDALPHTPQSVILYDDEGRRAINVDLKTIQAFKYPQARAAEALKSCSLAAICNINFARPLLARARMLGKPIATDVHAIEYLEDEYNRDFMASANILFQSHENLRTNPEDWAWQLFQRYGTEVVVVGMGAQGVMLGVRKDNFKERIPAVKTRDVVNTVGAGDALFSAFLHYYAKDRNPYDAIAKAQIFASYKVGARGAADGFLTEAEVDEWTARLGSTPDTE